MTDGLSEGGLEDVVVHIATDVPGTTEGNARRLLGTVTEAELLPVVREAIRDPARQYERVHNVIRWVIDLFPDRPDTRQSWLWTMPDVVIGVGLLDSGVEEAIVDAFPTLFAQLLGVTTLDDGTRESVIGFLTASAGKLLWPAAQALFLPPGKRVGDGRSEEGRILETNAPYLFGPGHEFSRPELAPPATRVQMIADFLRTRPDVPLAAAVRQAGRRLESNEIVAAASTTFEGLVHRTGQSGATSLFHYEPGRRDYRQTRRGVCPGLRFALAYVRTLGEAIALEQMTILAAAADTARISLSIGTVRAVRREGGRMTIDVVKDDAISGNLEYTLVLDGADVAVPGETVAIGVGSRGPGSWQIRVGDRTVDIRAQRWPARPHWVSGAIGLCIAPERTL